MQKQRDLTILAEQIIADDCCPELAAQATQLVMGSGNPNADIVLIGEAPGKSEDEQGVPFVGASGRFLDTMLQAANLTRSDIYITNIVKYRPPNNRDPSKEEKAAFSPFLSRQLEIISPRVVMTLGKHSGEFFIPQLKLSQEHGEARVVTLHDYSLLVIPLYHPAAALYNGKLRPLLINDFVAAVQTARTQVTDSLKS